jgi:hypothetical protein
MTRRLGTALHGYQERRCEHDGPEDDGGAHPIGPSSFAMEVQLAEHFSPNEVLCSLFVPK